MTGRIFAIIAAALCITAVAAPSSQTAQPPATWDGLTRVKAKRMDDVYLLPGADFRTYTKVILDPTEVAFKKNWQRDYNDNAMELSRRISDSEAKEILDKARTGFETIFRQAYQDAGYQVVTEPAPDVLRVRTAVANLYVSAPDIQTAGRSRTYSEDAGSAVVIIEVRDSLSGALLGRAMDGRTVGDAGPYLRNSVTNRSDFEALFKTWAKTSINGLAELKALSPIGETAAQR